MCHSPMELNFYIRHFLAHSINEILAASQYFNERGVHGLIPNYHRHLLFVHGSVESEGSKVSTLYPGRRRGIPFLCDPHGDFMHHSLAIDPRNSLAHRSIHNAKDFNYRNILGSHSFCTFESTLSFITTAILCNNDRITPDSSTIYCICTK